MTVLMELCGGDLMKRDWMLWNVTLDEAARWENYLIKRRYEWVEIIGKAIGGDSESGDKPCRHQAACNICRKPCAQRLQ